MSDSSTLHVATILFNRYTPIPVFILGLIGNIFNILVFTRRALFKNPCAIYLLSATFMNMNALFFGLLIRSLMDGFDIDVIGSNLILCRLRYLILHPSITLSSCFLVLASIDRFCISSRSVQLRNFSKPLTVRRIVIVASCLCLLLDIHILGLFEIQQLKSGPYCYAQVGSYRIFYDFLFFASYTFLPPIFMMIIGLATVRNIRLVRVRRAVKNTTVGQLNRKDHQLMVMLLVQLIATTICTLPDAILKLYLTFTVNDIKTRYRLAIENLITQLTRQLIYIDISMSFYLYITSSSSTFRHEFSEIINKIIIFIFGDNGRIHRLTQRFMGSNSRTNHLATIEQKAATTHLTYPRNFSKLS